MSIFMSDDAENHAALMSSTQFIKKYDWSMYRLKKLIRKKEIKATKFNGRYVIDVELAENWHKSLFGY